MNRSMRIDVNLYDIGSVREPGEPHPMAVTWYNLVIICLDIGSPCQFEDLTPASSLPHRHPVGGVVLMLFLAV